MCGGGGGGGGGAGGRGRGVCRLANYSVAYEDDIPIFVILCVLCFQRQFFFFVCSETEFFVKRQILQLFEARFKF